MKAQLAILLFFFLCNSVFCQIDTKTYHVDTTLELSSPLKGKIRTIEWLSASLNEERKISVYEPVKFHKDSTYEVVLLTDNQCSEVASLLELEMIKNRIRPLLIIGLHNRDQKAVDSILNGYSVDFRMKEMLGDVWLIKNLPIKNDSNASLLFENRHENFMNWIINEVVKYLETHYNLSSKKNWTLGGFSNGGSAVLNISKNFPDSFGNIICMSPAMITFELTKTNNRYLLCAGTEEPYFHSKSLEIADFFQKHNVDFEHKTYLSGHDRNMWMNHYFYCLTKIYQK